MIRQAVSLLIYNIPALVLFGVCVYFVHIGNTGWAVAFFIAAAGTTHFYASKTS